MPAGDGGGVRARAVAAMMLFAYTINSSSVPTHAKPERPTPRRLWYRGGAAGRTTDTETPLPSTSWRARKIQRESEERRRSARQDRQQGQPRSDVENDPPQTRDEDDGANALRGNNRPNWVPDNVPGFTFEFDPIYYLKVRKTFEIFRTKLTVGADFNTQLNIWQMRSIWEDKLIGGRLTVKGRELQLTKTWPVPLGDRPDLAAKLKFKLGVDLYSGRTYCRFGFRTEDSAPAVTLTDGVSLHPKFPLDSNRHVNVEVKSRVAVPTPNLEFKSELAPGKKLDLAMGDVYLGIEEIALCLEY